MNLLVLKDLSASQRRRFKRHRVFVCPGTRIRPRKVGIPNSVFDYVLVTSQNALRFAAVQPRGRKWVAIGAATARSLVQKGVHILKESHSEGVLKFFRSQERGRIFFPRSSRGDRGVVRQLRKMGFRVTVRHTYDTEILNIRKHLLKLLSEKRIDAVFLSSPSAFLAVKRALGPRELRALPVRWVCIGPTTARVLRRAGLRVRVTCG